MEKIGITKAEPVWSDTYNEDGTRKEVPRMAPSIEELEKELGNLREEKR